MPATVTGWIAYAEARGLTVVDDVLSSAALVRGTDYIKYNYVQRIAPGLVIDEIIEEATYIAAAIELTTPSFFSKTYTPGQQKTLTEVKGIKWTPVGTPNNGYEAFMPTSTLLEAMFDPYVTSSSQPNFLFRALGTKR